MEGISIRLRNPYGDKLMPVRESCLEIVRCVARRVHAWARPSLLETEERIMATVHAADYPFMHVDFRNRQRHVPFGIRHGAGSGQTEM
jgi:hypothetical protein